MNGESEEKGTNQRAAEVARQAPHPLATECADQNQPAVQDGQMVGLDGVDSMALAGFPEEFENISRASMKRLATDLAREGATGSAAKRFAARDVALARTRLRVLEGLQALSLNRCLTGADELQRVEALQDLIMAEHRRMLAAMDLLRRTERVPAVVAIRVNRAAVMVNR